MLLWARKNAITIPDALGPFLARMMARPAVKTAMTHEGLI
jgi:glutathione S-transferase